MNEDEIEVTSEMVEAALYLWPADEVPLYLYAEIELAKIYRAMEAARREKI